MMRDAARRREVAMYAMTREQFEIVREAAAKQPDAPPDLDKYIWLTWSRIRGQPLRTWLKGIGVLQKIDRCHALPYPPLCRTEYGWDERFGVVYYTVRKTHHPV